MQEPVKKATWADLCDDEDPEPRVRFVKKPAKPPPTKELPKELPKEAPKTGPNCYCGEPSKIDTVTKAGKREKIGTPFVSCASGACKYWFALPVPDDLPDAECLCSKPAAACKVKNPESRHFGKYISTCAFSACKFYKIQP